MVYVFTYLVGGLGELKNLCKHKLKLSTFKFLKIYQVFASAGCMCKQQDAIFYSSYNFIPTNCSVRGNIH